MTTKGKKFFTTHQHRLLSLVSHKKAWEHKNRSVLKPFERKKSERVYHYSIHNTLDPSYDEVNIHFNRAAADFFLTGYE